MHRDIYTTGQRRIAQVFRYLNALNQVRNPPKRLIDEQPWVLWLNELPAHSAIARGMAYDSSDAARVDTMAVNTIDPDEDYVLKVRRAETTPAPSPPSELMGWVRDGWQDVGGAAEVWPVQDYLGNDGTTMTVRFEDDPQRVRLLEAWHDRWDQWANAERPAHAALKLFERFYDLYGQIERESERHELVLGDGILNCRQPTGDIDHPVLLQRLHLKFDPHVPEFRLIEADHPVELYSALLRTLPEGDGRVLAKCRAELEQGQYHPLDEDATSGFLRRLVSVLSPHGEYVGQTTNRGAMDHPRMSRSPVVFLRARTLGYATALDSVLDDLQQPKEHTMLPSSLLNIVGVEPLHSLGAANGSLSLTGNNEDSGVLFSKPANREQVHIAQRLERYGCVLVQGPPGTGKTHTIANLVGHLLAHDKKVLITSHTTKALRVLRHQVVEELQPLCVSVLDNDAESREQLESSVEAIVRRLSSVSLEELEKGARALADKRDHIIQELAHARQQLTDACADEYRPIVIAGESCAPSTAARLVASGRGHDDWIPSPAMHGAPLPLSANEVMDLYRTNTSVTREDEAELARSVPEMPDILDPAEFERLIYERHHLASVPADLRRDLWRHAPSDQSPGTLEALCDRLEGSIVFLDEAMPWRLAAIDAGRCGGNHREPWEKLLAQVECVIDMAVSVEDILLHYGPALAMDEPLIDQQRVLDEIVKHLEDGGKIGTFALLAHPTWKRMLGKVTVSGTQPRLPEHFRALLSRVRLEIARQELVSRWQRQMTERGGPGPADLGERPEEICGQYLQPIRNALDWYLRVWTPLEEAMERQGFRWTAYLDTIPPHHSTHGELLRMRAAIQGDLPSIFASRAHALAAQSVDRALNDLDDRLACIARDGSAAQIVEDLRAAVARYDSAAYRRSVVRLINLQGRRSDLDLRRSLLRLLDKVAPGWAAMVRDRQPPHDGPMPPGDASRAWLWRQYTDELDARGATSPDALQARIGQLTRDLYHTTAELVERRAWAAQLRRTHLSQRQALIGWLQTVRKIGKGTGKRAPRLQAEARKLMAECRSAVPVWIMPLARVVENFDPRTTRFDVVIVDEASQSDVMALIALYMGAQVVVVGDHEQVSPDAVGQDLAQVQQLIDEHLLGIPNSTLYDGQLSVYDLAMQSFGGVICLREHFRSVPDIIQFSNDLSYNGQIKPLRDPSSAPLIPHVIAYRVKGALTGRRVNMEEALAVASLLVAAVEQTEYTAKTFGVISLVGEEQAREIERLVRQHLSPVEYERRRIICGNAAQFQGDERDIMFLSVVDSPQDGPLPLRDSGSRDMYKKRFNVAASRARDQMWVVHSVDPETDLKPGDLRRRLIQHARDPQALLSKIERAEQHVESEFERQVMRRLVKAEYSVHPQWRVGYYRIDLVVESGDRRLAIECDGDQYHPVEKLQEDMERQAILERLGWTFVRIRGSDFFRDPDSAMKLVFTRLTELGIQPEGTKSRSRTAEDHGLELQQRVIRRADELRREWAHEDTEGMGILGQASEQRLDSEDSSNGMSFSIVPEPPPNPHERPMRVTSDKISSVVGLNAQPNSLTSRLDNAAEGAKRSQTTTRTTSDESLRRVLMMHIPRNGATIRREALLRAAADILSADIFSPRLRDRLESVLDAEIAAGRLQGDRDVSRVG